MTGVLDMPASGFEKGMPDIRVAARDSPNGPRVAILVLIALFLVPTALTLIAAYTVNHRNQPGDDELTTNFISHQAQFDELIGMLEADRPSLLLGGTASIDLAGLSAVLAGDARLDVYKRLIRLISVADLRYFPRSGKVILRPAVTGTHIEATSKSYVYIPGGQAQPTVAHRGYSSRGPGMYFLTGDRLLTEHWCIHYDATIALGFSPY